MTKHENLSLTPEQITAIKVGVHLGRTMQNEFPEIAEDFRRGKTMQEIIEERNFTQIYSQNSYGVIRTAVGNALWGTPRIESLDITGYEGLIPNEEHQMLTREHKQNHGILEGHKSFREGYGIHAQTTEEKSRVGKIGGKGRVKQSLEQGVDLISIIPEDKLLEGRAMGRKKQKELGVGIFGLTEEQKKEYARRAVEASGNVPYSREEEQTILRLGGQTQYIYDSGQYKGKLNCVSIAQEVNRIYHGGEPVRNPLAISLKFRRLSGKRK